MKESAWKVMIMAKAKQKEIKSICVPKKKKKKEIQEWPQIWNPMVLTTNVNLPWLKDMQGYICTHKIIPNRQQNSIQNYHLICVYNEYRRCIKWYWLTATKQL